MNWQKLVNVNPPLDHLLMLHIPDADSVKFAIRKGNDVEVGDGFYKGQLDGVLMKCSLRDLKTTYQNVYWCLYKRPGE